MAIKQTLCQIDSLRLRLYSQVNMLQKDIQHKQVHQVHHVLCKTVSIYIHTLRIDITNLLLHSITVVHTFCDEKRQLL